MAGQGGGCGVRDGGVDGQGCSFDSALSSAWITMLDPEHGCLAPLSGLGQGACVVGLSDSALRFDGGWQCNWGRAAVAWDTPVVLRAQHTSPVSTNSLRKLDFSPFEVGFFVSELVVLGSGRFPVRRSLTPSYWYRNVPLWAIFPHPRSS